MIRALTIALAALGLAMASPAAADSRLFSGDAPLTIVITAPFRTLVQTAKRSTSPYAATLTVTDGAAAPQSLAIQLRARGMTRRTGGYCDFPPIQLDFGDKAKVHDTLFKGQHKLKLVTYCKDQPEFEQRIILEYLAYRLYNTLTPMSFRVRPAQVTYRNNEKDAGVTRFGFLVEDLDDVADRNHAKVLKVPTKAFTASQLDPHAAGRAAMFEFMIGNLDWDFLAGPAGLDCCHNAKLVALRVSTPQTAVVPIAYDFDYSGLVDSPYAGPPEGDLPISSVTERLYRGYCVSSGEIPSIIAEFRAHRAEMMALVNGDPRLNARFRGKTVRFLDGFFSTVDDPGKVQSMIIKRCR